MEEPPKALNPSFVIAEGTWAALATHLQQDRVKEFRVAEIRDAFDKDGAELALLACRAAYQRVAMNSECSLADRLNVLRNYRCNVCYLQMCAKPRNACFTVDDFDLSEPLSIVETRVGASYIPHPTELEEG